MNLRIDTSSICTWEIKPFFANGEISSMGTRGPKPCESIFCGGGTWSQNPPDESQITTMALVGHTGDAWIWRIKPSSQVRPLEMETPVAGWLLWSAPGCTKLTLGSLPADRSVVKAVRSFRLGDACELVKN